MTSKTINARRRHFLKFCLVIWRVKGLYTVRMRNAQQFRVRLYPINLDEPYADQRLIEGRRAGRYPVNTRSLYVGITIPAIPSADSCLDPSLYFNGHWYYKVRWAYMVANWRRDRYESAVGWTDLFHMYTYIDTYIEYLIILVLHHLDTRSERFVKRIEYYHVDGLFMDYTVTTHASSFR